MSVFKKLQQSSNQTKKLFIFGVLFVLALPMLVLIVANLQKRAADFNQEEFVSDFDFSQGREEELGGAKEVTKELEALFQALEDLAEQATNTDLLLESGSSSTSVPSPSSEF